MSKRKRFSPGYKRELAAMDSPFDRQGLWRSFSFAGQPLANMSFDSPLLCASR